MLRAHATPINQLVKIKSQSLVYIPYLSSQTMIRRKLQQKTIKYAEYWKYEGWKHLIARIMKICAMLELVVGLILDFVFLLGAGVISLYNNYILHIGAGVISLYKNYILHIGAGVITLYNNYILHTF